MTLRANVGQEPRARASVLPGVSGLLLCGLCLAIIASMEPRSQPSVWFWASVVGVLVPVAIGTALAYQQSGSSLNRFIVSPFAVAAITWIVLFVVRPLELYFWSDHAAQSVGQFGFEVGDLTRSVALAGLGCTTFTAGYLLSLGRRQELQVRRSYRAGLHVSPLGAGVALSIGTILWGSLFIRQGGLSALLHSPVSIRTGQTSSFQGFLGVWIVQGTVLYAFLAHLSSPTRAAKWVLAASLVVALAAGIALQVRGLTAFAAFSIVVVYVAIRNPSRRKVIVGAALVVVAVVLLAFAQEVRQYSGSQSTTRAVRLALRTPITATFVSDLSGYDNLVAIVKLVPSSIGYLDGETLVNAPFALVPRALWAGKPIAIDSMVSAYLYPGSPTAVPIAMQGELYWNGGIGLVAVGALILGLALGLVGRLGLKSVPGSPLFLLYAVCVPFTFAILTRGLATMTGNLLIALVGVTLALAAVSGGRAVRSPTSQPPPGV